MNRVRMLLLIVLGVALTGTQGRAADPPPPLTEQHRAFLEQHCQRCHAAKHAEARFRVDDLPLEITDLAAAERWQKVLAALNSGEMPPADEPRIAGAEQADFLEALATALVVARKRLADQHGAITMRRLNRREYRNTLRSLLGVEINVSELPADVVGGSFDTVGANLFMSSDQFEQYLALGREAIDEALERRAAIGVAKSYRLEGEELNVRIRKFIDDTFSAHERGKQWVAAVDAAMNLPENAAVVAELRKTSTDASILRRGWARIHGAPAPESFGFNTGENNADKANRAANNTYAFPYYRYYLEQPALDRGAYLTIGVGNDLNSHIPLLVPFSWPVGDYMVRLRVAAVADTPRERRFLEFGIHPRHGQVMSTHEVTGTMDSPQTIEIPLTLTRGHRDRDNRTLFIREKGTADHYTQTRSRFDTARRANGVGPTMALWVDWFEIERKTDLDQPAPEGIAAIEDVLALEGKDPSVEMLHGVFTRFATAAFRGIPPEPKFVDRLLRVYEGWRKLGRRPDDAFRETLAVVLASPRFLYLAEPQTDDQPRRLTGSELATRLSYFLWGSPPDARLRDLGAEGALLKLEILAAETERLLDDPRSAGFRHPFVEQWLGLDRLDFFEINREKFPRFDDATKQASRQEIHEMFAHLWQTSGSLGDLLQSDYVVINSVLAEYYGIEGVTGDSFRRVPTPAGSPRGGLLGTAAICVMGGNGDSTSPVERGAWVLRKLLNDPPPPAPANVPLLTRLSDHVLTTAERLALHQEAAQCASCHRKIDPIGLGLENFDPVGQWRTTDRYALADEKGKPDLKSQRTWTIDPAVQLHRGPRIRDYFELRNYLATRTDDFARGFSTALVEYALGRPVGFSDEPLLEVMTRRAREEKYSLRAFIQALVASDSFHVK